MLCFILDTPHRGRYFHDCSALRHSPGNTTFISFLASRRALRGRRLSVNQRHEAAPVYQNRDPRLTACAVSHKLGFFIKLEGALPHGDHPQPDSDTDAATNTGAATFRPPRPSAPRPRPHLRPPLHHAPASPPTTRSSGSSATPSSRTSRARSSSSRRTSRSPPTGP